MSLVFAGVCSHAPGITGRAARADARVRDAFYAKLDELRQRIEAARPDALIVVAAEHFANGKSYDVDITATGKVTFKAGLKGDMVFDPATYRVRR